MKVGYIAQPNAFAAMCKQTSPSSQVIIFKQGEVKKYE
jgi:hypothetical protein